MTPEELAAYAAEFERCFRERTPPKHMEQILPEYRVPWSYMWQWFEKRFGRILSPLDRRQAHEALKPVFRRLMRDFPDLRWTTKTGRRKVVRVRRP